MKEYNEKYKEQIQEYMKEYYETNKAKIYQQKKNIMKPTKPQY